MLLLFNQKFIEKLIGNANNLIISKKISETQKSIEKCSLIVLKPISSTSMHTNNLKSMLMFQNDWRSTLSSWSFNFFVWHYFICFCCLHSFFEFLNILELVKLLSLWICWFMPCISRVSTYSHLKWSIVFIIVHGVRIIILVNKSIENSLMLIIILE